MSGKDARIGLAHSGAEGGRPSRGLRRVRAALLLNACAIVPLSACAADSYAGIPLAKGAADRELRDMALRARTGDRAAQLALADRYERGDGVAANPGMAAWLRAYSGPAGRTASVYSPYSPAGQPSLVPLELADPGRRDGNRPATDERATREPPAPPSRGQRAMDNQPVVELRAGESPLELHELLESLVGWMTAAGDRDTSADELFHLAVAGRAASGPAEHRAVPTTLVTTLRDCRAGEDGIQVFVGSRFCRRPNDHYLEIFIRPASLVTMEVSTEFLDRYAARRDAFTIDRLEAQLDRLGFRSFGVVSGQSSVHGFVTPLVHTAFARGERAPIVVAGHRPRSASEGDARGLPPAVLELRLYFPSSQVN